MAIETKLRNGAGILIVAILAVIAGCDSGSEPDPIVIPDPRTVDESDFITSPTGVKTFDFTVGHGSSEAVAGMVAEMHYIMWLESGQFITSSFVGGLPVTVTIGDGNVVPGWEEGLLGMRVGGDRQIVIPSQEAYGTEGLPSSGIPPDANLIVEVALLRLGFDAGG